jgi:hypothetical protein
MNMKKSMVVSFAAVLLALGIGLSTVFAQGGPTRVSGGREATAAAFVEYIGHDGVIAQVPSINTIGNRITFGFNAKKYKDGTVGGQLQLVDHTEGLVIHSDVVTLLVPNPVFAGPVGSTGLTATMGGSIGGVTVNGEPLPGWSFVNSPLFDGGEGAAGTGDTICFELIDPSGVRVRQWSAFLSSGNVQVVD